MSEPRRIVLATRNAHKIGELRAILADLGVAVDLVGVAEYPDVPDVPETELTFAGNAMLKAVAVAEATGLPAIADDSGICVDALNGMPGIFSARWSGKHGADAANLDLLLAQVSDVPDEHRGAAFVCAAAFAEPGPDGARVVEEGRIEGVLLRERHGAGGFGYDPVFKPHGHDVSTAELTAEAKNRISHRRRAFAALAPHLVRD
ncbi:MAG TPA: RdgB/HAM1 family non-canonical purine NTP pyrophosphatase [Actinospica sp.]|nr:RdgB/HAM1 family non-canonical purine NTP pyrophosphatase [Actinospica sp.]